MIGPSWWNRPAVVAGVSARYRGLGGAHGGRGRRKPFPVMPATKAKPVSAS